VRKLLLSSIALIIFTALEVSGQTLQYAGSYPTQFSKFMDYQNYTIAVIDASNLLLLDVNAPSLPLPIGSIAIAGQPQRLDFDGNLIYVASGDSGLQIIDISSAPSLSLAASYQTSNFCRDVIVRDTLCYLLCDHRFIILNVADFANIIEVSNLYLNSFYNSAMDIKLNDIYFFADHGEFSFVQAINVADPLNLRVVAGNGTEYCVRDVCVSRNTLLAVSDCFYNLYTFSIAIPDSILSYHYFNFDTVTSVCTGLGYAFTAVKEGGIRIVDYSHPDSMEVVGSLNLPGSSLCVRISDHYLYVADSSSIQILSVSNLGHCRYVVGDINNSGFFNSIDIIFAVSYFSGGRFPAYYCECTANNWWFAAGDVNASCNFNGVDVTYAVSYFKGGPPPHPCALCPPQP
jgi:hypothetical protein